MKKMLCACILLLSCLLICGCSLITPLPHLSADEKENVEIKTCSLRGEVTEIMRGVLVVKMNPYTTDVEKWGEYVYLITFKAGDFCVGDFVEFEFSRYERPTDATQYLRIYPSYLEEEIRYLKPIIYLYPEVPTECSVRVDLDGGLSCTYPEHGDSGWNGFLANPDGTLVFPDGREYYALYWEGLNQMDLDLTRGFCVKGEDTSEFLEWALAEQGLTPREANEFIVYWLPQMQENEYNVISFQTDGYTDSARLEITPTPDTLIRVFMTYYSSDAPVEIEAQELSCCDRLGFTVVEWGGGEVKKP